MAFVTAALSVSDPVPFTAICTIAVPFCTTRTQTSVPEEPAPLVFSTTAAEESPGTPTGGAAAAKAMFSLLWLNPLVHPGVLLLTSLTTRAASLWDEKRAKVIPVCPVAPPETFGFSVYAATTSPTGPYVPRSMLIALTNY